MLKVMRLVVANRVVAEMNSPKFLLIISVQSVFRPWLNSFDIAL